MNLISKAVVNLWSIYKPMNFRGRYLITYAISLVSYVVDKDRLSVLQLYM